MTPLLKNLLGNGARDRELAEEMRTVLDEIRQERTRYEKLVESSSTASERLEQLSEPIENATSNMSVVAARLAEIEQRLEAMNKLAGLYQELEGRAESLTHNQKSAESRIAEAIEGSQKISAMLEEVGGRAERVLTLKDQLDSFLETDQPLQVLRNDANALRAQLEGAGENVARLREQHDRLLDAHKLGLSKMEALDRRREELSRDLTDKERRVASVEQSLKGMDGVQHSIDEVRRETGALKAMADLLSQKTAALETQREAVDRALAQAEHLDRAMRQVDAGVRQQQENEKQLGALQERVAAVRALHETVHERSNAISQLQREIDERTHVARQELAAVTAETRKTVEHFDFERRGLETVTQRVADLRAALSDCESRFKGLSESSLTVAGLDGQTQSIAARLQTLGADAGRLSDDMTKLNAIRRDLDDTGRVAREVGVEVVKISESRPAIEAALRELGQLSGAHASVHDSLEQAKVAQEEITRMRENQSSTRDWLMGVERSVRELRERVGEMQSLAPAIDYAQKQTQRIGESLSSIEARREMVEDLQRRMTDFQSLGQQLDERGRELQSRMEAAEQRFVELASRAEEAERVTLTVAKVASGLKEAEREADDVRKTVAEIASRAESVEGLAEETQALKKEVEQRQHGLAEAAKDLKRVAALRQEAAAATHKLDETVKHLDAALAKADERASGVDELASELEDRGTTLLAVKARLDQFEERLAKWDRVDQSVARALEDIASRQTTVGAIQSDLDRMFAMAEKTAEHVREITSAHSEIEGSRELLTQVMDQLREVRNAASALDERKRQMAKAEERLARAEGLLVDIGSSLEALQGQKAIVDQAVEKAGSLQYLLKQAEAAMEGLREERKTTARVHTAVAIARQDNETDDDEELKQAA